MSETRCPECNGRIIYRPCPCVTLALEMAVGDGNRFNRALNLDRIEQLRRFLTMMRVSLAYPRHHGHHP